MANDNKDNIILLLTGTVKTGQKIFTAYNDETQRKEEYINTVNYYLHNFNHRIVFVENSNTDLSSYFEASIKSGRLEFLFFDGNTYPPEIGKGLGEIKCIEYAISNSLFISSNSFVFKITGRYIILNLNKYINFYKKNSSVELIADFALNFKSSIGSIFGFKPFFAKDFLFRTAPLINDSKDFYFEHALAKAVLEAIADNINFRIFKHYPVIKAISGTTGKPYKRSFFYLFPRKLKYFLRYFTLMR